jgi:hypothetical protein
MRQQVSIAKKKEIKHIFGVRWAKETVRKLKK